MNLRLFSLAGTLWNLKNLNFEIFQLKPEKTENKSGNENSRKSRGFARPTPFEFEKLSRNALVDKTFHHEQSSYSQYLNSIQSKALRLAFVNSKTTRTLDQAKSIIGS